MAIVTIRFAKAHLLQLINRALRGEEIVIARGKKPVVRVVAIQKVRGDRKPGAWKGKFRIRPEFFELLPPEVGRLVVTLPIPSTT
jgi:antitoxin (DNA-binding transcriptional repressor) of toxin-antitoxin stability system